MVGPTQTNGNDGKRIPPFQLIYPLALPCVKDVWSSASKQEEFGHARDGGRRAHAGIDLIARDGTPVLAMASGTVRRISPAFYEGTGVIEIAHPGLGIVRYGEVTPKFLVREGQTVVPGQVIGLVGKRRRATRSMLHLELYADWNDTDLNKHPLTDPANHKYDNLAKSDSKRSFERRHDLENPTTIVNTAAVNLFHDAGLYGPALGKMQNRSVQLATMLERAAMRTVTTLELAHVGFGK